MQGLLFEALFETEGAEGFAYEDELVKNFGGEPPNPLVDFDGPETKLDDARGDEYFFAR